MQRLQLWRLLRERILSVRGMARVVKVADAIVRGWDVEVGEVKSERVRLAVERES